MSEAVDVKGHGRMFVDDHIKNLYKLIESGGHVRPAATFNDPPWHPIKNAVDLKHLGKLGEEVGELGRIVSRTIIQGLDGIDPENGKINREELQNEIADVIANIELCAQRFGLTVDHERIRRKKAQQRAWHEAA
jgi:NTP pyrophosphatase (non-canonical NTP hydrolase)